MQAMTGAGSRGRRVFRAGLLAGALLALAGCDESFDFRGLADPRPADAGPVRAETAPRPEPDARGVISYPSYQVVAARAGDTVTSVAERLELEPSELARFNGIAPDAPLRRGEILALPRRVATTGAAPGGSDIASIASAAIERSRPDGAATGGTQAAPGGAEPVRHRVERGETAFSIARLYNVSVRSLADWNGLGADLAVREGQYLVVPLVIGDDGRARAATATAPGTGTPTPEPPSAARPLPAEVETARVPESPRLGGTAATGGSTAAATPRLQRPAPGRIIRAFSDKPGGYEGIDIGAEAGTAVLAADDGEIALVSPSANRTAAVLVRHSGDLFTAYANVTGVTLEKGARVSRGQRIGAVAPGSPSFVHFQVRRGVQAVDPVPFIE